MTVRSLGLALVLSLSGVACAAAHAPPTEDETSGTALESDKGTPAPANDRSTSQQTSKPAKETADTNKADTATTPGNDANTPAKNTPANATPVPGGAAQVQQLQQLQACITGCERDTACVQACVTDLAGGAGLPELPGG